MASIAMSSCSSGGGVGRIAWLVVAPWWGGSEVVEGADDVVAGGGEAVGDRLGASGGPGGVVGLICWGRWPGRLHQ